MARNYYETLGLPITAAEREIAASLDREFGRVSSLQRIPTRQAEAEARRQALQQIQQTLLNPTTRSKYDAYLSSLEIESKPHIGFTAPGKLSSAAAGAPARAPEPGTVFCSSCGKPARVTAKFCAGCGTSMEAVPVASAPVASTPISSAPSPALAPPPPMPSSILCVRCGRLVTDGQNFCGVCGASTSAPQPGAIPPPAPSSWTRPQTPPQPAPPLQNWSDLSPYYQNEFRQIQDSNETYRGKWNWAAFFFGCLWGLTKGLWLSFLICVVVSIVTGGFGGIVYWFIYGARGNYLYYCSKVKDKQLPL